ncbi:hypothetical protein SELMODRAFT_439679 [Selaginella moellendorffii]|uniref:Uncharacterized protein n=1 Tax=Selaginella moellendorffii TaxID=88036 RepID=D8R503_SELML|nr:uncharacterized protein LOC9634086 [Selaginella moellendorffii]EFJ32759.1 hypothetical protein SELMODRAFT_439679 [Selaginella moellendorffii]|eukprot:XP_002966732.1 uncharacterized protein LOC9634086 [Selaginella moellendorffii]
MQDEEIFVKEQQPKLLQNLGKRAFVLARYAATKAVELPRPLGPSIALAENFLEPIFHAAGTQGLDLLKFLDDRIYVVGEAIETCLHSAIDVINYPRKIAGEFQKRGIVGSAADIWVEYKDPVTNIVHKLPGSGLVSPVFHGLGEALALDRISKWLVEHSEVRNHDLQGGKLKEESEEEVEEEEENHAFVEAKVVDQEFVADKIVEDHGHDKEEEDKEEEDDELTKLLDAGWGLGGV